MYAAMSRYPPTPSFAGLPEEWRPDEIHLQSNNTHRMANFQHSNAFNTGHATFNGTFGTQVAPAAHLLGAFHHNANHPGMNIQQFPHIPSAPLSGLPTFPNGSLPALPFHALPIPPPFFPQPFLPYFAGPPFDLSSQQGPAPPFPQYIAPSERVQNADDYEPNLPTQDLEEGELSDTGLFNASQPAQEHSFEVAEAAHVPYQSRSSPEPDIGTDIMEDSRKAPLQSSNYQYQLGFSASSETTIITA